MLRTPNQNSKALSGYLLFSNGPLCKKVRERVLRVSAVKLIDGLAGESPASASYPVGTVVISGDGAGDQAVGSPDVKALHCWSQVRSAPTGGQANHKS